MSEPWLSVIGGGLVAAVVTILFSAWWDRKKQKMSEDWEFKRYQANQIHYSVTALMDSYFSAKSELLYLTSTLSVLLMALHQLEAQADTVIRQQVGAALTVEELERRKREALQPFKTFNDQQVFFRWGQYELKAKENHAKAEAQLMTLQRLVPPDLYRDLVAMFQRLSAPFVWDLPHAQEKFRILEEALPEVVALRERLSTELEKKLGRASS
jgi:hypothetical protein